MASAAMALPLSGSLTGGLLSDGWQQQVVAVGFSPVNQPLCRGPLQEIVAVRSPQEHLHGIRAPVLDLEGLPGSSVSERIGFSDFEFFIHIITIFQDMLFPLRYVPLPRLQASAARSRF